MSGETEIQPSSWTIDSAMAHLQRQLDDLRDTLKERQDAQAHAVEVAFSVNQTAMQTALAAADKALDRRASDLDKEFHEHLEQVRHENALAFKNSDRAITAALASQERAVNKAEASVDQRLEKMNEFRKQLSDQAATFVSRAEDDAHIAEIHTRIDTLAERITLENQRFTERLTEIENRLSSRLDLMAGQATGAVEQAAKRRAEVAQLIAVMSVILVAVGIILRFNS